jgi:hypothetical protein
MPITRHFLGWDGPALQRCTVYLRDELGRGDGGWDLGHVVAVLPAQRAVRRLLEVLADLAQSDNGVLVPPRIVTAGRLPELLYEPTTALAGELDAQLAWVWAMRSIPADDLHALLPHPPAEQDLPGWWAQSTPLRRLREDLAAHLMHFEDVPRLCAQRGIDQRGEARWAVLAAIERAYRQTIEGLGLTDRHTERLEALKAGRCTCAEDTRIVLIATPDLNDALSVMLRQVGDHVTALVMAPDHHADGFDELGTLRVSYWQDQQVDLHPDQFRFVGRNSEQADAVVSFIAQTQRSTEASGDELGADQVTIGLGDERFAGPVRHRLDLAAVPCRSAAGTPTAQSRPAQLLRALGRFMESQRLDAMADLLRHPDVEAYLHSQDGGGEAIEDWLSLLDLYATDHLQGRLTDPWLGRFTRPNGCRCHAGASRSPRHCAALTPAYRCANTGRTNTGWRWRSARSPNGFVNRRN